jgi:hypothetical protein
MGFFSVPDKELSFGQFGISMVSALATVGWCARFEKVNARRHSPARV